MRRPASFYLFGRKPIVRKDRDVTWRKAAGVPSLRARERLREEDYPASEGRQTLVSLSCGHHRHLLGSVKRYILTAVDHTTEPGYARMYRNKSSRAAADFLYRLRYLVNQRIENLQTDNGSEFAWEFERATAASGIERYFSRARTPKDNPEMERFNQTLEYEWLYNCNLSTDPEELNPRLTEWLTEYDFNRPISLLPISLPCSILRRC